MEVGDVILYIGAWVVVEVREGDARGLSFDATWSKPDLNTLHIHERWIDHGAVMAGKKQGEEYRHQAVSSIFLAKKVTLAWSQ
jgi:hypothetical protein